MDKELEYNNRLNNLTTDEWDAFENERMLNREEMENEWLLNLELEKAENSNVFVSGRIDIDKLTQKNIHKIFLIAGVGAGKSTWVKEILPEKGNVLFVTSRRAKVDEDEKDSIFVNRANPNDISKHYYNVITNSKLEKSLKEWSEKKGYLEKFTKRYDYIVIDEVHSMATDATFADSSFGVKTFIEYVVSLGKTIICMTGTPEPVESYFYKNHWYKIDLRKICNYVKPYKIDVINQNSVIDIMKQEINGGKKIIYFINITNTIKPVYEELLKTEIVEDGEIAVIVAEDKHEKLEDDLKDILTDGTENFFKFCKETYDEIINNKCLPERCRVLLSTSKLREGIDIKNEDITIICDNHILSNIIQFCGRVRVGGGYVYIIKDSTSHEVTHDELLYEYAHREEIIAANKFLNERILIEENSNKAYERSHFIKHLQKNPYIRFNYIIKQFQLDSIKFEEEIRLIKNMDAWEDILHDYCNEYSIINPYMTDQEKIRMLLDVCNNMVENQIHIYENEKQKKFARIICEILNVEIKVQKSKINKYLEKYGYKIDSEKETAGVYRNKTYWFMIKCAIKK